jgi:hypothetical protein
MNRKLLKVSVLMLGALFTSACAMKVENDTGATGKYNGDVSGHTFLSIRPEFQSGMPEKESLFRRRATATPEGYARECGIGGNFQAVVFGGRTTQSQRLGEFFMYGGSNVLTVSNNPTARAAINPLNFGVAYNIDGTATNFASTIQFNPRQSFIGGGFEYKQYLSWCNCASNWWFDVSFPVINVRNSVHLTETGTTVAAGATVNPGAAANMTAAFAGAANFNTIFGATDSTNAPSMMFGLIPTSSTKSLKHTGVADVELKIGYDALCNDDCFANGYIGVLVPTGNRPKGVNLFEPIVGHNRHVGFMFGGTFCYDVLSDCDRKLSWDTTFDSRYLFRGRETRSFDLKYRPWSRYNLVYTNGDNATDGFASPGINVFTQDMNVTPRFYSTMNSVASKVNWVGTSGLVKLKKSALETHSLLV